MGGKVFAIFDIFLISKSCIPQTSVYSCGLRYRITCMCMHVLVNRHAKLPLNFWPVSARFVRRFEKKVLTNMVEVDDQRKKVKKNGMYP